MDALATELYVLHKAGGVAPANRLARERVEKAWQTFEGKISLVSGKQVLSKLSAWSQSSYGVSVSSVRVAAGFNEADILEEVVDVLRAIEHAAPLEGNNK